MNPWNWVNSGVSPIENPTAGQVLVSKVLNGGQSTFGIITWASDSIVLAIQLLNSNGTVKKEQRFVTPQLPYFTVKDLVSKNQTIQIVNIDDQTNIKIQASIFYSN